MTLVSSVRIGASPRALLRNPVNTGSFPARGPAPIPRLYIAQDSDHFRSSHPTAPPGREDFHSHSVRHESGREFAARTVENVP